MTYVDNMKVVQTESTLCWQACRKLQAIGYRTAWLLSVRQRRCGRASARLRVAKDTPLQAIVRLVNLERRESEHRCCNTCGTVRMIFNKALLFYADICECDATMPHHARAADAQCMLYCAMAHDMQPG